VTQRAKNREAPSFVISPNMAKALADEWRSRILMELSVRPMSPSRFVKEVGGELWDISRCFTQLAQWGHIELIEVKKGEGRRGGEEHIYRRVQRAHFDTPTWEGLPLGLREEFSGSNLESYIARISEAVDGGTFDAEVDRHLSWDGVELDRVAWKQLGARLDEVLDWLPELGAEAAGRMGDSRELAILTTVGLAAFRSPHILPKGARATPPAEQSPTAPPFVISAKMAKALANKWRSRILLELSVRPLSPSQFVKEVGGDLSNVSRYFHQLVDWGYIELIEVRRGGKRRGGTEHIYRKIHGAHFDTPTWEALPIFLREEFSVSNLESYIARISEAVEAGTFDAEVDRHLSWDGISLDRIAWKELMARLDEILHWLPELEAEAAARIEETREEPIPTTVGLAAFRSPETASKAPPRGHNKLPQKEKRP
jgi:DNA-binding transcriptional ArsR family regulator